MNGAKVGAVSKQMGGKGMAERVRVHLPIHVGKTNIFFYDAADGALGEAAASIIQKNSFGMRRTKALGGVLREKLFADRPIGEEGFLSLGAVWHDALLVALAADAKDAFGLVNIDAIEAGKFAHAQTCGVKKFEESAVALDEQAFFGRVGL